MRKFGVFASTILISVILAGLYGIIHDQVTYSISNEYFTKFKYEQFGVEPVNFGGDRQAVAVIGFLATWWTGIVIGVGLGLTGLIYRDHKTMYRAMRTAIALVFCVAVVTGFAGFLYGKFHLTRTGVNWWFPDNLLDKDSFIVVGSIHNFSYLGGLLGLTAGIIYLIRNRAMGFSIITPNDPRYEKWNSRGANLRFKGQPSAIIPVATAAELTSALQYAVDKKYKLVIRGGGHCLENFVSNPVVETIIDISKMKGVRFDENMNAIEVRAGTTLGEMHQQLYDEWRIVMPSGEHPAIGIGGHIQGGAFGFLCRQHGLGVDYLYALEMLWVDKGRKVKKVIVKRDSPGDEKELWWAHTGGGAGNFGVVTRYWFRNREMNNTNPSRLLPAAPIAVTTIEMEWSWNDMTELSFQQLVNNFSNWSLHHAQPGTNACNLFATLHLWNKSTGKIQVKGVLTEDSTDVLEGFISSLNEKLKTACKIEKKELSWLGFALHPFPDIFSDKKIAFKVKDAFLCQPFSSKQVQVIYRCLTECDDMPGAAIGLTTYGGKINSIKTDATATAQRSAILTTSCSVGWQDPRDEAACLEWVRNCYRDLYQETGGMPVPGKETGGCIIAHPDNDMADPKWNSSGIPWYTFYYQDNYPRLQKVKATWDPWDIFNHNLSVRAV